MAETARTENSRSDTAAATAANTSQAAAQAAAQSAAQTAARSAETGVRRAGAVAGETAEAATQTGQDMMRAGAQVAEALLSQSRDLVDASTRLNQIALKGFQSMTSVWTDLFTRELSTKRTPAAPGDTETARAVRNLFEASASVAQISSDCLRDAAGLVRETGNKSTERTRELVKS